MEAILEEMDNRPSKPIPSKEIKPLTPQEPLETTEIAAKEEEVSSLLTSSFKTRRGYDAPVEEEISTEGVEFTVTKQVVPDGHIESPETLQHIKTTSSAWP